MGTTGPRYSKEAFARRGDTIYERDIRPAVEAGNAGKFVVIDIETGDYEMDDDDLTAALRAYAKNPDGARYEMQIGYATSGTIGIAKYPVLR